MLYFCQSFEKIWHAGLLYKLETAGVTGEVLNWFKNYLSDRRQRVILPGVSSEWLYIRAGVPQGSVLGPLLFLLFINDTVTDIGSNIRLFADDTSLFIIISRYNLRNSDNIQTIRTKTTQYQNSVLPSVLRD